MNENHGGRKMSITTFAYLETQNPPVKSDANGNYVPIDNDVILHKDANILFAPIWGDYISDYEDTAVVALMEGWKACASNISVWYYDYYFSTTSIVYLDSTYSLQSYFLAAYDAHATWVFVEGNLGTEDFSVFKNLRAYLISKLGWDVHADVHALTDAYFTNYYKDTIRNSFAYKKNKYNDGTNRAGLSIVNSVGGEQGRFLKVDVKNGAGNGMGYMNLYLQCVQTKQQLQNLLNSGYKTIRLEYFIDAQVEHENSKPQNTFIFRWKDGELTGSVNYGQECVYNKEDSFGKWVSVDLPLANYINHYDELNNVNSTNAGYTGFFETSFEKNKLDSSGNIIYNSGTTNPQKLEETNPYVIYIKPIKISK